jgi:hypothetical protein
MKRLRPRLLAALLLAAPGCSFPTEEFTLVDAAATPDLGSPDVPSADDTPAADVPPSDTPATDTPAADVPATDTPAADVPATACSESSPCPIGSSCCSGRCLDTQSDAANCGACGMACATGQACCAGACVATATSAAHCGRCGNVCEATNATPACAAGACGLGACTTGYGDCDSNAANGCETDTRTDLSHCGACGRACTAGTNARALCVDGACQTTCASGFADCDNNPANGCEANTVTSPASCGACGVACPPFTNAATVCAQGACGFTCRTGFGDCDGDASNGCEVNTGTSAQHCGACGAACTRPNSVGTCTSGTCAFTCAAGFGDCDSDPSNGCERALTADNANCGACGRACAAGTFCSGGTCQSQCAAGTTFCNGACVNLQTSATHCGMCGRVCPVPANGAAACVAGACTVGACNTGFGNCDGNATNGCETNLNTSAAHCGQCRDACSTANATPSCAAGVCSVMCATGFADCDRDVDNGCETSTRTLANCGACGRACTLANATATCTTGTCAVSACTTGFANCNNNAADGCEVNTTNDNANCGACGRVCAAGTACSRGVCSSVCATGLTFCGGRCVDLQSDRANCGACGRACATSPFPLTCNRGACSFPPPANDVCTSATEINLAAGSRIALSASTSFANHDLNAPCAGVGGADVFYRFTLTRREYVYADTFGASWDTKLFFATSCTTPLVRSTRAGEALCNDNRGLSCTSGGNASQVVAVLDPGTYYLVLTVQAGSGGGATINFEHLPTGNGNIAYLSAGRVIYSGVTAGTSGLSSSCGGSGPENSYFWVTCPGAAGGTFSASTCSRATWDTLLHLSHGSGTGAACNQNSTSCGTSSLQSLLSTTVPAGAGLHAFFVDGWGGAQGSYSVDVTRPATQ